MRKKCVGILAVLAGISFLIMGVSCSSGVNGTKPSDSNFDDSGEFFMGFENVISIPGDTSVEKVSDKIYSVTEDTTIKFSGAINAVLLKTVMAAMQVNDSVNFALDLFDTTGITEWKKEWFEGSESLYAISLPKTVTTIQKDSFTGCKNLKAITVSCKIESYPSLGTYCIINFSGSIAEWLQSPVILPDNRRLYLNGKNEEITNISIPTSVTKIKEKAFYGYRGLTCITIPSNVEQIGNNAFYGCTALKEVFVADGNTLLTVGTSIFYNCPLEKVYLGRNLSYSYTTDYSKYSPFQIKTALSVEIGTSVTYIGSYAFFSCTGLTSITIPDNVISIGEFAFAECKGLISITIPSSITSIGKSTFSGCTGLTSIIIPSSIKKIENFAFSGCTGLTGIKIPNSVTSIGESAFRGCKKFKSITIPESVTDIGKDAFDNCTALKEVIVAEGNIPLTVGSKVFSACPIENVYIGRKLSYSSSDYRDYSPLQEKTTLVSVEIGTGVTSIEKYAFYNCSSLTSVIIPYSVTSIGEYAFEGCKALKEIQYTGTLIQWLNIDSHSTPYGDLYISGEIVADITIPETVTSIRSFAFYGCTSLRSVTIPVSVTSIGEHAFYNCNNLTKVYYSGTYTQWITINFGNTYSNPLYNGAELCASGEPVTSIIIPDDITSIDSNVLSGFTGITSITIPSSVTKIEKDAFNDCTSLKEIIIEDGNIPLTVNANIFSNCPLEKVYLGRNLSVSPFQNKTTLVSVEISNSVTSIENKSFYGCKSLTSITIPESVTNIGEAAFNGCTALKEIIIADGDTSLAFGKYSSYSSDYKGLFYDCPLEKVYLGRNLSNSTTSNTNKSPFYNNTTLVSVEIGTTVTSIKDSAFFGCANLENVTISDSVTSVGKAAFSGCTSLNKVYYNGTLEYWLNINFNSSESNPCYNGSELYINKEKLIDIKIPKGVKNIKKYAFCGCYEISSLTISNTVTTIENNVFNGCISLKELIIEDGDTELTYNSTSSLFNDCPLETIYLGRNFSYNSSYSPFYNKKSLISVEIGNNVTTIGKNMFDSCSGMTNITIGENVEKIEIGAFDGCIALSELTIKDGQSTLTLGSSTYSSTEKISFYDCPLKAVYLGRNISYTFSSSPFKEKTTLISVEIGNNVKSVKSNMFYGCTGLTNLTIGDGVTDIGQNAFYGCTGLIDVSIGNGVINVGKSAFYGCTGLVNVTIGNNVTKIEDNAFFECTSLTSIRVPNNVLSIGQKVFYECSMIKELVIEDGDVSLMLNNSFDCPFEKIYLGRNLSRFSSFAGIKTLVSVEIGTNVTSIVSSAFSGCTGLTSITIPSSVTSIERDAFRNCTGLKEIKMLDGVTSIGSSAFSGCTGLTSVTIPSSVTNIEYDAFRNCTGLKEIKMLDGVTSIGSSAFSGCNSLTSVTIPNTVTRIEGGAFENCKLIKSISIPNSVKEIGEKAFYGCNLESVTIPSSVTEIKGRAFEENTLSELIIEDGDTTLSLPGEYLFSKCRIQKLYIGRNLSYYTIDYNNLYTYYPFSQVEYIGFIEFGNKVTSIGKYLFYSESSLTSVIVGKNITSIEDYAFSDCNNLSTVYYRGSEEEWKLISIGSYNTPLKNATVIYNYTGE